MVWQAWTFSAITSLAILTGIAAAGWTALRLLRRYATRGAGAEPACARCGYLIHPGSRRRCPECGSDLAQVGVVTPSTLPPIYPVLGLWLGAVGLGYVATELGPRLAAATPWGWGFLATDAIETTRHEPRYLNSQGVIGVQASGHGRWWGTRLNHLLVAYVTPMPSDRSVRMDVEPDRGRCWIFTSDRPDPAGPLPVCPDAVAEFVRQAEFAPDDPEGRRVRAELWGVMSRFLRHNFPPGTTTRQPSGTRATWYFQTQNAERVAIAAVWVVCAGTLAIVLHRMHRRLRQKVARRAERVLNELQLAA